MQNKTALVVDDSRVARMTLGKLLKAQDFVVTEQDSGEAALSWLQETAEKPDIIFMDVMMGGMDGLTACTQIKSINELNAIPVVICTGNDSEAELEKALATGAAAVLSKPPAADALQALLDDVTNRQAAAAENEAPVTEQKQAVVDVEALIIQVREQLLPELQQQIQTSASEISRNTAQQVAAEASDKHGLSLIPEISRQVIESAQQHISEVRDSLTGQADEVVTKVANQAIEQAMQNYGLTEKIIETLDSEGNIWLSNQQDALRDAVLTQVQQELQPMVEQYLDEQLIERVQPLVESQFAEVQQLQDIQQHGTVNELRGQLHTQRNITLAVGAVALAALLIPLF